MTTDLDDQIAKREASRKARKDALEAERKAQYLKDLEALDAAEQEYGDSSVGSLEVPFTPGLPTLVVFRAPEKLAVKIYRSRLAEKKPDMPKAAAEIGLRCLVYPDRETFDRMVEVRPGIDTQLGQRALGLSIAKIEAEGES